MLFLLIVSRFDGLSFLCRPCVGEILILIVKGRCPNIQQARYDSCCVRACVCVLDVLSINQSSVY